VLRAERQSAGMSEIKNVGYTSMALNTFKYNCLTPLHFKGLTTCHRMYPARGITVISIKMGWFSHGLLSAYVAKGRNCRKQLYLGGYIYGVMELLPCYYANQLKSWWLSGGYEGIGSYQNFFVLDCVTAAHLCEQFLRVQQIGFVTLGPLRCA